MNTGCKFALIMLATFVVNFASSASAANNDAFGHSALLGRGINIGNALEAPKEGEWGVTIKPEYFRIIRKAGFSSVRVPIRWSAHAGADAPFTIDPAFFKRIDWVVEQALANDLVVVLDLHHYWELMNAPDQNALRFVGLWAQISEHYQRYSDHVYFELLNEPEKKLSDEKWQQLLLQALNVVRKDNPTRTVIVGPGYWNSLHHLDNLNLPSGDKNIVVTFHYYIPIEFTFQGSSFADSEKWRGITWSNKPQERAVLVADFDEAAAWSARNQRPLYLGEFGANQSADMDSRALWTRAVVDEARKHGFSWSYWEFCYKSGAFDPIAMEWRAPLLGALIQPSVPD